MKRLTQKQKDNNYKLVLSKDLPSVKAINKLGKIEDLEESLGIVLVDLFGLVGKEVYYVYEASDEQKDFYDIAKGKVMSFSFDDVKTLWFYVVYDNGLTYWHKIKDLNNEVFFTKAEAEKK